MGFATSTQAGPGYKQSHEGQSEISLELSWLARAGTPREFPVRALPTTPATQQLFVGMTQAC